MKRTKPIHVKQGLATQNQQRQVKASSWSQWGKAAFAFTVATGVYALAKIVGGDCSHEPTAYVNAVEHDNLPVATVPEALHLIDAAYPTEAHLSEQGGHWGYPDSPLLTFSALAFSSPRYSLVSLSTLGFLLIQQLDVTQAAFPAVMDLANLTASQGCVVLGAVEDDRTGISVSQAGDVNGDGLDDVLVGVHWADPLGRSDAGSAILLFGRNGSWPATLDLANINASEGVVLQGAAAGDQTGYSISRAGDVNGDGLDDVLVGAYRAFPLGRTEAGTAYLLFGRNGSWPATLDLGNLNATDGVVLQGAAAGDWTGRSVSNAGDVNGDGLDDLLVGAERADPLGRTDAGSAILLFARNDSWPATLDLGNLNATDGVVLQGAAVGDRTGWSVSHIGDVNGDGLDDVLVGAHYASPLGRTEAGSAYLLFGRNGSWPATLDFANITVTEGVALQGAAAGDRTGISISHAGDINGDMLDDVLVGAFNADPLGRNRAGSAILLFGRNGSWAATLDLANLTATDGVVLQGAAADDYTGRSVSHAGDVNGDGLNDVLVGADWTDSLGRTDAGSAILLFGRSGSWPATIDFANLNATEGVVLQGAAEADETGISVSQAGDLNGDGLDDVLVGAHYANPLNRTDAGVAYIIFGQRDNPLTMPTTPSIPAASSLPSATANPSSLSTPADSSHQIIIGFTVISNSVLYAEIGIEVIITTDNLSVEGFSGDPNELIFSIPLNSAYSVTVNGEEQNSFPLWAIQQGFVGLMLADEFCFEDFNEIPVQATDGRTTTNFNLIFQGDTASCIFNDTTTLNAKSSLQGAAMLLVGSGFGIFASRQREENNLEKTESNLLKTQNDNHLEMKLSL